MSSQRTRPLLVYSLIATIAALASACSNSTQAPVQQSQVTRPEARVESQTTPSPNSVTSVQRLTAQVVPIEPPKLPAPKPTDIRNAVARVFEKTTASEAAQQSFVVGDFNGDGSEDLAVVVKPNENSLQDINSEVANWTLEDPSKVAIPGTSSARRAVMAKPVQAEKDTALLAIIHGVGPSGWRNADARQSYLLKNGAGSDMLVQTLTTLRNGKDKRSLPPLQGDAIQVTIAGESGLLIWTGAKYAWYTRQSQPEAKVH